MTPDSLNPLENQLSLEIDRDTDGETAQAALASPAPATSGRPPSLRRVWLKRFKQFEDFTLELGQFNVLVGANNSGKSTFEPPRKSWRRFLLSGLSRSCLLVLDGGEFVAAAV
jgi:hypothetical protein